MKVFKNRAPIVDLNGTPYLLKFRSNPVPMEEERIERIKLSLQEEYGLECKIAFTEDNCFIVLEEIPEAEIVEETVNQIAETN